MILPMTLPDTELSPETLQAALRQLLHARHSCRAFLPAPVPEATLDAILTLAQRTASWCNTQPWQVVVTRGDATHRFREALQAEMARPEDAVADVIPDFPYPLRYEGRYLERRRESGFQLYEAVGVARGDRAAGAAQAAENFGFFGAPHVAILTTSDDLGVYGAIDCGAWVSNFMLAARAHGVASIAQAALAARPDFLRAHFGLARDRKIVCGISFGYADTKAPVNGYRTSRAPLSEAVHRVDS
ncbi:MAG: nitroreductase [Variovorax sp.]|nr:nitroreductase [Variovorax sp.]